MNNQLWKLYKESDRGKSCIAVFNPEIEDTYQGVVDVFKYAERWSGQKENEALISRMYFLMVANFPESTYFQENWDRDSFKLFIEDYDLVEAQLTEEGEFEFFDDEKALILPKNKYRDKAALMPILSMAFYYSFELFKPLLLPHRFDIIQRNCNVLGIEIPEIPRTNDYKAYMIYYYDLCNAWAAFQEENGLTDAEFCACLYDFAGMLLEEQQYSALPKATNVWLTGASGKEDFAFLDSLGKDLSTNSSGVWACNERTRRGDIVILYCTSPRSYIHSIWRANSNGIFNPFDYYHCRTTVCDGILTPRLSSKELKEDAFFSTVPIVKKNLQGLNGVELSAKEYHELLRLIQQKGGNVNDYPQLYEADADVNFGEINIEKDVEEKILIPLLRKLGYDETDWTRQLSQKAGRKEKAIPDFVFFPRGEKHFENAPMVIEAKLDMAPVQDAQKAFNQCLSYARMLRSSIMGICDKERLLLFKVDANGAADRSNPLFENHWITIFSDPEVGASLNKLIGKETIEHL
ncbi:MAG: type I restriction enzyme HsdR N-terminal domain-containing protein [Parabacteroides sp.]|nr:type I restriction enzyme HsdR N-terminal domain-containing protein [Parabacteroides sp.]